jgi:2'-5' RNA ligase
LNGPRQPARAVVIFPAGEGLGLVEAVRRQHDPQSGHIAAHITLVFPFESELGDEALHNHVEAVAHSVPPFQVRLQGVSGHEEEYLFLNFTAGIGAVIALHDRLYTGPLSEHLSPAHAYRPHITLGRLRARAAFYAALRHAQGLALFVEAEVTAVHIVTLRDDSLRAWAVSLGK